MKKCLHKLFYDIKYRLILFKKKNLHPNPIASAVVALLAALILVIPLSALITRYNKSFLENILGEAHGMILDILVIGIFILWLNNRAEVIRKIKDYRDEISDFLPWNEKEATYRIVGIIKRLNRLKINNIYLAGAYLRGAFLPKINLKEAILTNANLIDSILTHSNLQEAHLEYALLQKASLIETNLIGAFLQGADLRDAFLIGADLNKANLENADLRRTDIRKVKGLTLEQLSKVKSLYGVEGLDDALYERIKEYHPNLFKEIEEKAPFECTVSLGV